MNAQSLPKQAQCQPVNAPAFGRWLMQFAELDSALGDLAREAGRDPDWPTAGNLFDYELHLFSSDASPAATRTLRRAWALYCRELGLPPPPPLSQIPHAGDSGIVQALTGVPFRGRLPGHIRRRLGLRSLADHEREWGEADPVADLVYNCVEQGWPDQNVAWAIRKHRPSVDRHGGNTDAAVRDAIQLARRHRELHDHEGWRCFDAHCPNTPDWMTY